MLGIFFIPRIYLRNYFYYCVVIATETPVVSVDNFGTFTYGIHIVMGACIVVVTVVFFATVAVAVGGNQNKFY